MTDIRKNSRMQFRAKLSDYIIDSDIDSFLSRELAFCEYSNRLFYKKSNNSLINFKSGDLTMLFSSPGLIPYSSNGCGYSQLYDDGNFRRMGSEFLQGTVGFWNIIIPSNYSGYITGLTFMFSGESMSSNETEWKLTAKIINDETVTNNPVLLHSYDLTLSKTSTETGLYNKISMSFSPIDGIDFFGPETCADRFCDLSLTKTSGNGTHIFYQMKINY